MTLSGHIYSIWSDGPRAFQIFQVVRQATAILIGILLAKSGLSLGEIGTYELWMYISAIWAYFWFQGTNQAFMAWYPKLPSDQKPGAFLSLFFIHHVFSLVLVFIFIWNQGSVGYWLAQSDDFPFYHSLLILLPLFLMSSITPIFLMFSGLNKLLIIYSGLFLVSQFLAVSIPLLIGEGLSGIMTGLIIAALLHYAFLILVLLKTGPPRLVGRKYFSPFIKSALPLITYTIIGAFAPLFDSWLVNFIFSNSEVFAVFRYGAKELPLSLALAGAFHMGMIAEMARDKSAGLSRVREGAVRLMKWFFPITMALILLSKPLYTFIFSPSFAESAGIFNVYLLIVVSRWIFPHSILMALGKNNILIVVAIAEMLINVTLSIILVKMMGLIGIAFATVIAYWFEKFCLVIWVRRQLHIRWSEYMDVRLWAGYSLLTLFIFTIVQFLMFT